MILRHQPSGTMAEANERRSQKENYDVALQRLRIELALHVRSANLDPQQFPSALWRQRCPKRRIAVNPQHHDFAVLLAEALDCLSLLNWDAQLAADQLNCSASQLVKFLKVEPQALAELNLQRKANGKPPLR